MKKILCIIMCAVLICVSFCACSGPNADLTEENITETVEVVETALKDFDTEKLDKYVDSSTLKIISSYAEKHDQFKELGKAIFSNLEFDIIDIDTENLTVTISVINKDLYAAAISFASELKEQYSAFQLLNKLNDDSFLDAKLKALCNDIDECELLPDAAEMTLTIRQEKKNLVLSFDDNAENIVSGGALNAIKGIYS